MIIRSDIFDEHGCLSYNTLEDFIQDKCDGEIMAEVQAHLDSCPLCADATEGLKKGNRTSTRNAILVLHKKIVHIHPNEDSHKSKKLNPILLAAASLILIFCFYMLLQIKRSPEQFSHSPVRTIPAIESFERPIPGKELNSETNSRLATINSQKKFVGGTSNISTDFDDGVYNFADEMPEFPGGIKALDATVSGIITEINMQLNRRSCGRVLVQFIVNERGEVTSPRILKSPDPGLSKAALKVLKTLPDFKPGKQLGTNVNILMTLPLNFGKC